jgi:hypothetical protein
MYKPLSVNIRSALCVGYAALNVYATKSSAVSAEAQVVKRSASAMARDAEKSQFLFGEKAVLISSLRDIASECSEPDWDGYGARAIDPVSLLNAESFVRAMPEGLPLPECAPEPDGAISLDWIQSKRRFFSLSVGGSNRLAYAWLDGYDIGHAVAHFDGLSVPARVLDTIKSIVNYGTTTLRVA